MQKRSKRFGLVGIVAMALCLFAAVLLVAGCSQQAEPEKDESPAALAPQDKEPEQAVQLPTEPFYMLIVGNDSRAGTADSAGGPAYSDTLMLTRVDPVNYQVTTITIPRDTQAYYDGSKVKINESYAQGGIDTLRGQVYELTGVEPEYYFDMGFLDFVQFIDALGGVTVNVPVDMSLKDVMTGDWIELSAGEQTLDGAQALVFSRVRKIFAAAQDACRQMDDRSVVASVLNYIANNPDAIEQGVSALYDNAETNWDRAEFTALVEDFAKNADKFTILSGTGPYDGDIDGDTGQWMAYRDEGAWHQIIETVDAGGDPTEIVGLPYQAV